MIIKRKDKVIIFLSVIVMILASIILIYNINQVLKYKEGHPKDIAYTTNVEDNNNYEVILKSNPFINNEELNNNFSYITSLIDYINTNFTYQFTIDKNIPLNFDYYIKANIVSKPESDMTTELLKPIWNKEFILTDHRVGTTHNSKITIAEALKIDLDYYNDLITLFKSTLNIPVTSTLEVKLMVNIKGELENNTNINKDHYMLMSIPLDVQVFDIKTSTNYVNTETIYNKELPKKEVSYLLIIIYISSIIAIIYIGMFIIQHTYNRYKSKSLLIRNKILKDYSDRIVTISNFVKDNKFKIINVTDFEELVDLANEAYEPILYWNRKDTKEAWFIIIRDNIVYRYILPKKGS